ncbi:MAG: CDC48 family AAA ATPase [Chloroflexi bacterium]|nr:CDC48 family AAA ATPase [Chloroflexota bacterium]
MAEANNGVLKLTVAEALPKDVGRAIARMDPGDISSIGLRVGDIVEMGGKRKTAVKVMPSHIESRGTGTTQIDGIIRENAQVSIGEQVQIQQTSFNDARTIVLAPTSSNGVVPIRDTRHLERSLEGLPLTSGDRVRATLFGSRYQEFLVEEVTPKGVVVVNAATVIKVKDNGVAGRQNGGTTYEDIGGLHKEIQRIREIIELPLKHPELFERLGIEPPKGVLLHGPPGCGKTLIARAVANETDASFFHISGPDIIHKFYGESEAHLRAIFEKAKAGAPGIIFIDEIDAIASKREEVRGDQQVERRVVAQLLALMDGLQTRGQVVVIGATNIPNVLDPALRRPGRFDREISISVPDRRSRLEILHIHTRGMPLSSDVDLGRLAEITHGFVGADLESLCREAAMTTLRKAMPRIRLDDGFIPYEVLMDLQVTMDNFLEALKDVEPSAIREVFTETPSVKWNDVGGLPEAKQILQETIEWPLRHQELFQQANTKPPKGILLTGSPGTGKTLLAKAVASECEVNFISVKGPAILSKWVGESERAIQEVFKKAKQASPCILFFDEIDALVPVRAAGSDSHVTERIISQFLTELDGIEELRGVTVLAATNRPDILEPALLRPGRLDVRIELPLPSELARREIFDIHTRGKPLASDVDLDRLSAATDGLVGAAIEAVCRRASMLAIREFVNLGSTSAQSPGASTFHIASKHFEQAITEVAGRP